MMLHTCAWASISAFARSHARCHTQELFRESVKRKNQQLDLLQSEVRRLKTSVSARDETVAAHIDAALNAQEMELKATREQLVTRDGEMLGLNRQLSALRLEVSEERSKRHTDRSMSDEVVAAKGALVRREEEVELLRSQLAESQELASRLLATSTEAQATLEARDAELATLRARLAKGAAREQEHGNVSLKLDEAERALAAEKEARAAAEEHVDVLERARQELESQREGADLEMMRLRSQAGIRIIFLPATLTHSPCS